MSTDNIRPFFQFERVKIYSFGISQDTKVVQVKLEPDNRFLPICSGCKKKSVTFILMSTEQCGI
jgi:hypothetical protein